jgi:methylmalonyl-CoA mutase cobalamin-binding domain/chain
VQEIAFSMSNAMAVLDAVRDRVDQELMGPVFGRISFFVNAGVRFVEEHAKLRAMSVLWEELGRERYGVTDPKHLRFRYGVQVNSLGLTEQQPENNVQRIVLEALAVTLGRNARARAVQLPAWNEALGLPRPWDQQWSLRLQQVLAFETDILEYPDIFEGSKVMEGLVAELLEGARAEMAVVAEHGGAVEAVPYMKAALVDSHRERIRRIEAGEQIVVGLNKYTESEPSPLTADAEGGILVVDPETEAQQREALEAWRSQRDQAAVDAALAELKQVAEGDGNLVPATIAAARRRRDDRRVVAGAARRVRLLPRADRRRRGRRHPRRARSSRRSREEVEAVSEQLGRRIKILVGKPGLDGHSNGAEQIAVRARDAGMDVVYEGIRLTPAQIAGVALQEGVHVVGLSILSGSHRELIPSVIDALREAGVEAPVVVGGIIPEADVEPAEGRRRRRGLHARRTSTSRRSCATSSAGRRRARRVRVTRARALARRRLRDRDLSAAPAALNLDREPHARPPRWPRCCAPSRPPRWAASRPGTSSASPGRRARASRRCSARSCARGATRADGRGARRRPVVEAQRRARCSATAPASRSTPPTRACSSARPPPGAGSGAWRPRRAPPPTRSPSPSTSWSSRPSASGSPRPRWPRSPTRSPSSSSPARATRCSSSRRDHGGARRARRDQGRPGRRRAACAPGPQRGAALARRARQAGRRVSSVPPAKGIDELVAALDAHRAGLDLGRRRVRARRTSALADFAAEHGERGCARSAAGAPRCGSSTSRTPGLDVATLVERLEERAGAAQ